MAVARPYSIHIGQKELPLPVFFPSVSSVKTVLLPMDYLQVLSSLAKLNGQFLVSAFDLAAVGYSDMAKQILNVSMEAGVITLMDSGNYESFWKEAQSTWNQRAFHGVLQDFPYDIAFCFDEHAPPKNFDEHVSLIVTRWREDQAVAGDRIIVPIVHGASEELPVLCTQVAEMTGSSMIAVAERRLGDGIIARARSVEAIRRELNTLEQYVALHLLGTGNPISIALYAIKGADSFDGLEWCQTVVDHDSALLFHLSHSDFFEQQTDWADANLSFHARTLAHNLEFYTNWMRGLRIALFEEKAIDFCQLNFPSCIFHQCALTFGWR